MTYKFNLKNYQKSLAETPELNIIPCPIKCNERAMLKYAHSKGCTPPELTDDEKSMFFEGGIENFRKWMRDHNQYTGF